jgi:hypothetical protein
MTRVTQNLESYIKAGDVVSLNKAIHKKKLNKRQQFRLIITLLIYCESSGASEEDACGLIKCLSHYCDNKFIKYFYYSHFCKSDAGTTYLLDDLDPYQTHMLLLSMETEIQEGWENNRLIKLITLLPEMGIADNFLSKLLEQYLARSLDGSLNELDENYIDLLISLGADINQNLSHNDDIHSSIMGSCINYYDDSEDQWLVRKFIGMGGEPRLGLEEDASDGLSWFTERSIDIDLKPNEIGLDGETDVTRELSIFDHEKLLGTLNALKADGADFNVSNRVGDYPINKVIERLQLEFINESFFFEVLEYILKSGADLRVKNSKKQGVIIQAVSLLPVNSLKDDGLLQVNELKRLKRLVERLVAYDESISRITKSESTLLKKKIKERCPSLLDFFMDIPHTSNS